MIFLGKGIYAKGVLGLKARLKKMSTAVKPPCSKLYSARFSVLKAVLKFNFAHFTVLKRQP